MTASLETCKFCRDTGVVWFAGLFSLDDRRFCTCAIGKRIFESIRTVIFGAQKEKARVLGSRL